MDRRSAITAAAMDKPAVTERADTGGDLNARPMTANSFTAPQEGNTNAARAASDSEITTEVQSAIAAEGLVKDGNINVTTTQGVVALSGSVPSQSAIDQVKEVAAKVKDVRRVDTSGLILASL